MREGKRDLHTGSRRERKIRRYRTAMEVLERHGAATGFLLRHFGFALQLSDAFFSSCFFPLRFVGGKGRRKYESPANPNNLNW